MKIDRLKQGLKKSRLAKAFLYPAVAARRSVLRWRTSIQDDILNNLSDILADDPVLRIAEFQGKFVVDLKSRLFHGIVKSKDYEPQLALCCLAHLDRHRDAVDIGANIGFYTVLFGKELRGRRVLAIEPTPNALCRLYRNIELNDVGDSAIVFEGVASDHLGTSEIHIVVGKEEYSSLGVMEHPAIAKETFTTLIVQSTTVDRLVEAHSLDPGFIKIDVEGMEHVVLLGMQDILMNNRPVLLLELVDGLLRKNGSSAKEVIGFLEKYDYDVIDPLTQKPAAGEAEIGEILCLPKRK